MEEKIWDFFLEEGIGLLDGRGILYSHSTLINYLKSESVYPLIALMEERGIQLLTHDNNWWLNVNGEFRNSTAGPIKSGQISELEPRGRLFWHKNRVINPFYRRLN